MVNNRKYHICTEKHGCLHGPLDKILPYVIDEGVEIVDTLERMKGGRKVCGFYGEKGHYLGELVHSMVRVSGASHPSEIPDIVKENIQEVNSNNSGSDYVNRLEKVIGFVLDKGYFHK